MRRILVTTLNLFYYWSKYPTSKLLHYLVDCIRSFSYDFVVVYTVFWKLYLLTLWNACFWQDINLHFVRLIVDASENQLTTRCMLFLRLRDINFKFMRLIVGVMFWGVLNMWFLGMLNQFIFGRQFYLYLRQEHSFWVTSSVCFGFFFVHA